jgi:hypothetical protein
MDFSNFIEGTATLPVYRSEEERAERINRLWCRLLGLPAGTDLSEINVVGSFQEKAMSRLLSGETSEPE